MKLARISLGFLMLAAIILRSLPDSVFNYFHEHTHVSANDTGKETGISIEDYQHNCHIEDWNFESFDVVQNHFQPFQLTTHWSLIVAHDELIVQCQPSQNGRAPPIA